MTEKYLENKISFLGQLFINFKRSGNAYKNYLSEGETYLYARILKKCNTTIRKSLLNQSYLLEAELRNEAIDLICHYDIWLEKWNDLENKIKPQLNDRFIFDNKYVFPKNAEQKLIKEFLRLEKLIK